MDFGVIAFTFPLRMRMDVVRNDITSSNYVVASIWDGELGLTDLKSRANCGNPTHMGRTLWSVNKGDRPMRVEVTMLSRPGHKAHNFIGSELGHK